MPSSKPFDFKPRATKMSKQQKHGRIAKTVPGPDWAVAIYMKAWETYHTATKWLNEGYGNILSRGGDYDEFMNTINSYNQKLAPHKLRFQQTVERAGYANAYLPDMINYLEWHKPK